MNINKILHQLLLGMVYTKYSIDEGLQSLKRYLNLISLLMLMAIHTRQSMAISELNFNQTIKYALENSPKIKQAQLNLEKVALEKKIKWSQFFPSLDFSSSHGMIETKPSYQTTNWASSLELTLSENFYDNGQTWKNYQIANLQLKKAQLILQQTTDQLIKQVAKSYLDFSLANRIYTIETQQYKIINKQYLAIKQEYQQGLKLRRDYLRIKTQMKRSTLNLQNKKTTVIKSKHELFELMGGAPTKNFKLHPLQKSHFIDFNKIIPIEKSYLYKILQINEQISSIESDLIYREWVPQISLEGSGKYSANQYIDSPQPYSQNDQISWQVLVKLTWNLWDFGARRSKYEQSLLEQKRITYENRDQLLNLTKENSNLLADMNNSNRSFLLAKELLDLEQTNLEHLERDYKEGNIPYLDLIDGINNLSDAKNQYYTTGHQLLKEIIDYYYVIGELHEKIKYL